MPVCVTGMHRSGTSMIARLLRACGLDLGPDEALLPADENNLDGYWENRTIVALNDAILEAMGGAWDVPPPDPTSWLASPEAATFREAIPATLAGIELRDPWGWKDPRNALTMPLWQEAIADLDVVVCIRHPLEVAASLQRRGSMSLVLALELWRTYYASVLESVPPERRVVTSYGAYFPKPVPELTRLLDRLGLGATQKVIKSAAGLARFDLRHHAQRSNLPGAELPADIARLYNALLEEAERSERVTESGAASVSRPAIGGKTIPVSQQLAALLDERESLRRETQALAADRDRWTEVANGFEADRQAWRERAETAESEVARTVGELRRSLSEVERVSADRESWRERAQKLDHRLEELTERALAATEEAGRLAREGDRLQIELGARIEEFERMRRDRDAWLAEAGRLEDDRDAWQALVEPLETDRDFWQAEVEQLREDRDAWQALVPPLAEERDCWQAEVGRMAADRDDWQDQAARLAVDREAWRTEATHWRFETERLVELHERTLRRRFQRLRFQAGRRIWWLLPAFLRDRLRQRLFRRPPAQAPPPTAAPAPAPAAAPKPPSPAREQAAVDPRPAPPPPAGVAPPGSTPAVTAADETPAPAPGAAPLAPPDGARKPVRKRARKSRPTEPVSVLIPTLNAGPLFPRVLAAVRQQTGFGSLELIVADSGSSDGTRELAEAAGATLIDVPPGEFGHGRTRNAAAEVAGGEMLLMLVQDAVLLGPHAIRDLILELRDDPVAAAASARQLPRSDSDLYGAFTIWAHESVLRRRYEAALAARPEALDHLGRRSLAALDDVCALIRRSAWEELRFADVDFAEDLDFGMRAVARGWRIRLSRRAAVAHSHDRDAVYHFRRSIADRLYVAPVVGDDALSRAAGSSLERLFASMQVTLQEAQGASSRLKPGVYPLPHQLGTLRTGLEIEAPRLEPRGQLADLAALIPVAEGARVSERAVSILRSELLALIAWPPLAEFALAQRAVPTGDVETLLAKLAGSCLGRTAGDALRKREDGETAQAMLAGV